MKPAIVLFGVLILAACGGDGATGSRSETNGSIRGTVTDNTGANVANAPVALSGNAQATRIAVPS